MFATSVMPEELLSLAFDEAPQAIIVTSPEWRILHWGLAAENLFGWTAKEAVGALLDHLTAAGAADPSPPLQELATSDPEGVRRVVMRRHKNGRLMHVEVSWRSVRNEAGAIRFNVASKRDVSGEQLRRDVELIDERYGDLLDSVPDAIVIVNDVGSIVLFNAEAARLFGMPADSMIGAPVEQLIPERFAAGHSRHRERFASQPQRRPMGSGLELHGRRGDGSEYPVEVSLSPLVLGTRRFAMAALRDLSERVRIEEAQQAASTAMQASSAKTEFLSRMSHELRTPLNAILGFAQVLGIDGNRRLDETQKHQVAQILRAGRHLLAMMNDLLDVTRIETGALALSVESVEVASLLDEVTALCETSACDAEVTVEFTVQPIDLCVRADRLRLRQVLLNLLSNAIKYNCRGGRVDVLVSQTATTASITVRDTGVGLTAEQLARLYRPFDRLGAEASAIQGNGIGLVIARGLVQGMGGRIEVQSEPGRGSAFSVQLAVSPPPLRAQDVRDLEAGAALTSSAETTAARWCLLYVEDNEANIEVIQAVLALRRQWTLVVAKTGAQAVTCVQNRRPDLAIVDMHLPDTHGLDLVHQWDAEPATAHIARVALSADATPLRARTAASHGFQHYFTKPLDVGEFLAWLDEFERRLASG